MKVNLFGKRSRCVLIKLFGHKDCHKTKIYHSYLTEKGIQFVFWMFMKTTVGCC